MKITSAEFIKSAVRPSQYPPATLPEIAFVGRSNVGKSSLINSLVERKNLAKVSNTPGRTQLINFFTINKEVSFVDLPGYGFAKVSKSMRKDWADMIETYLRERQSLILVILIMDIRRDPGFDDLSFLDWLYLYRIPYMCVLTKTDKLSNNQALVRARAILQQLKTPDDSRPILFSAKTKRGKNEIWQVFDKLLQAADRR